MEAQTPRRAGRSALANPAVLVTAVFATTDPPLEALAGGSDDYCVPAAPPSPPPPATPHVRWRPRGAPGRFQPPAGSPAEIRPSAETEWRQTQPPAGEASPTRDDERRRRPSRWEQPEERRDELPPAPPWLAVSRGVAGFLGVFALLNVIGEMRQPGPDASLWWIDLRPLPAAAGRAWLALAGMLLVTFAVRPARASAWRGVTVALVGLLLAVSVWNTLSYYGHLRRGLLHSGPAVPFALHVAACLVVVLAGVRWVPARSVQRGRDLALGSLAFAACVVAFPLAQMQCAGGVDDRRPAEAAVVFGCRVHADGMPSHALAERVETACGLYHAGVVQRLILSGGPGPGHTHEAEAMRQLALDRGVPAEAIETDREGVNTAATVHNAAVLGERSPGPIVAVSHDYHLPRIRECFRRAGLEVSAVPAGRRGVDRPARHLAREGAALWWCWLGALRREL